MSNFIFQTTHELLLSKNPALKKEGLARLFDALLNEKLVFDENYPVQEEVIGALPESVKLVDPKEVPRRRLYSLEGRAAMIHALLHIECNAINIALDALYRFRHMPFQYYVNWLQVAREEAYHFHLLEQHLEQLGFQYGDFPAHQGLWEMTQKTSYDVLARMALVPRLLEARGLDVAPVLGKKLLGAGDRVGAEIISIIHHDEINHVAFGNYWYRTLCQMRQLDPMKTFIALLQKHAPDYLRGPFAFEARRKAGFEEAELNYLSKLIQ